jgi:hypothetical protein
MYRISHCQSSVLGACTQFGKGFFGQFFHSQNFLVFMGKHEEVTSFSNLKKNRRDIDHNYRLHFNGNSVGRAWLGPERWGVGDRMTPRFFACSQAVDEIVEFDVLGKNCRTRKDNE